MWFGRVCGPFRRQFSSEKGSYLDLTLDFMTIASADGLFAEWQPRCGAAIPKPRPFFTQFHVT